ncbi:porin family protein [Niveibacterium sp. 24ML]|uniref:outer membrane beta-barrel protein n=1 Tax=Niveibacterium sp. 24ML TaxID=2985512 RepID=UPI00226EB80D|nr:outer membrane beta-barrel protein [Niveibacterium sp. 24ML]MCX9157353.1 porin family protein [Niveibacterium sp. 24ML]
MTRQIKQRQCAVVVALLFGALSGAALAETSNDRYWAQLSGYWASISSSARLDFPGTKIPGTSLELEDELGLSDRDVLPAIQIGGRISQNWRMEFEYYSLERNGTRSIDRQINWGDLSFPASASVTTNFETTIYRVSAGYSFYKTPQAEAGLVFGLHMTDFVIALSGQASVGGNAASFQSESKDQLVPLPTLGLYGGYAINDKFNLRARLDYFSLNYDDYDGSLMALSAAVDWRFHKNFAAGIGYRYVDYGLEATKDSFHGEVQYSFSGPTLFLETAF